MSQTQRAQASEQPLSVSIPPACEKAIEALFARYPTREAALLPALHLVQDELGWLPVKAMDFVADKLGLPKPRVYGVASFYTMFRRQQPGKHRLEICTNLPCSLLGAEHLRDHLQKKLGIAPGQTTKDGLFTLLEVECLGSCGTAPVMLVDDIFFENLDPQKIDALLEDLRAGRTPDAGSEKRHD